VPLICIEYGLLRSAPLAGALSSDARLTSVCLSHTSGLSREQRGLGILNWHTTHGTHDSDTTFKVKGQLAGVGHIVAAFGTACYVDVVGSDVLILFA